MVSSRLNLKDKKILQALSRDARQSNSQIAKAVRLSKNIVNYRIKQMESSGIIKKYLSLIDCSRLGYLEFRIYLDLYELDPDKENELVKFLIQDKSLGLVVKTVGNWDLIITLFVKNIPDFHYEWGKIAALFRGIIKEYNTHLITGERIFPMDFATNNKLVGARKFWETGGISKADLDQTDLVILNQIRENARIPIKNLAGEAGLGSMAIIYRLKQLAKKKIILGHTTEIDFCKLGYELYKVNLELDNTKILKDLFGYCSLLPQVTAIPKTINDNVDFEFDLAVKDFDEFLGLVGQLKKKFPGSIRNYKYIRYLVEHKKVYLPIL